MDCCRFFLLIVIAGVGGCRSTRDLPANPAAPSTKGQMIPGVIDYEPPGGFVRNPYAPEAPQWWNPPNGVLPQIEFSLDPGEILLGEHAVAFSRAPSWEKFKELARHPRWPIAATGAQLSEAVVDGKSVLILDFVTHPYAHTPPDYWSRIWIPVAPNLFVQGFVSSDDPRQRDQLRQTFQKIKIQRYWRLPPDK